MATRNLKLVLVLASLSIASALQAETSPLALPSYSQSDINVVDLHQYDAGLTSIVLESPDGSSLPPSLTRQSVSAWQVNQGSWNGQPLAGVSIVLIQETPEDLSRGPATATLYVSDFATPAQRRAALDAVAAAHPELLLTRDGHSLRIEPAVIQVERGPQQRTILHIALLA